MRRIVSPVSCSRRRTTQSLNNTRPAPPYATHRRGRRLETIQTRAGDTTPPARARANVDNTDNERERTAPVCLYFAAPVSISTTEQTNRKPQPHENRRPLVESSPPAAVLLACVVLSPFAALHCKPRPVSCSSRQTSQSLNKTRPAPAYAVQTRPPCGDDTDTSRRYNTTGAGERGQYRHTDKSPARMGAPRVETIRPAPKRRQYRQHTKENAPPC